jgi:hypothetical protein
MINRLLFLPKCLHAAAFARCQNVSLSLRGVTDSVITSHVGAWAELHNWRWLTASRSQLACVFCRQFALVVIKIALDWNRACHGSIVVLQRHIERNDKFAHGRRCATCACMLLRSTSQRIQKYFQCCELATRASPCLWRTGSHMHTRTHTYISRCHLWLSRLSRTTDSSAWVCQPAVKQRAFSLRTTSQCLSRARTFETSHSAGSKCGEQVFTTVAKGEAHRRDTTHTLALDVCVNPSTLCHIQCKFRCRFRYMFV